MASHLIIRILCAGNSTRLNVISKLKLSNNGGIHIALNNGYLIQFISFTTSCEEAINLNKSLRPDIVLIDAHITGIGSIEATKRITNMTGKTKVIGMSSIDDALYPLSFFKAGATGFIHPHDNINSFLEAICLVKAGGVYKSGLTQKQISSPPSTDLQPFIALTERELQVAAMIAQGVNLTDIAKKLRISVKSIQTYKKRILKQLNLNNDVELSHYAIKHKIILIDHNKEASSQ